MKAVTTEEFIERSILVHGDRYDYSKSTYVNKSSDIEIICSIHGSFTQRPDAHTRGSGCKKCVKPHRLTPRTDVSNVITPTGSRPIALTKNKFAIVDNEDYERVAKYNWHVGNTGYVKGHLNGVLTLLHRFIMNVTDSEVHVDHRFHNKLDNRKSQLRLCGNNQNQMNQKPQRGKSSEYKGVSFCKTRNLWFAHIQYQKKQYNLGGFNNEYDAARAYNNKALEFFGEFAYVNKLKNETLT